MISLHNVRSVDAMESTAAAAGSGASRSGKEACSTNGAESPEERPPRQHSKAVLGQQQQNEDIPQRYRKILRKYPSYSRKKLKRILKAGLPSSCQAEFWMKLSGAAHAKTRMQSYEFYLNQSSSFDTQIEKDLPRTFPQHATFLQRQEELFRVLHALSAYNADYTQGLSYVTGFVLLNVPTEEDTFFIMCRLFENYHLKELYSDGFPHLHRMVGAFDIILQKRMPRLHRHFNKLAIPTSLFLHRCFLTMFAMQFPFELVSRIMDCFMLQKWRVLMKVALQLLLDNQEALLRMDYESLLMFLQGIDRIFDPQRAENGQAVDVSDFFNRAMKLDIKKKMNRALRKYDKKEKKKRQRIKSV